MASPSTSSQSYRANTGEHVSEVSLSTEARMQKLFGSFIESENSMENEVPNENGGDSFELSDQDEIMEDEENLFGVDKQVCEDMLQNGPQSGLEYESREDLFTAYQTFAKLKGFSISTRNTRRDKYLMLSCGRARKPNAKKCTKRMNCPARLNAIKQEYDNWKISKVCNEHNHDLDPQMSEFMPAHRTHSSISFAGAYPHMSEEYKLFQEMEREFVKCCDLAIHSEEKINFVKDKLKEIERELKRLQNSSQAIEIDATDTPILDPVAVTRKGRPKTARFKDPAENRKGRGCANVGDVRHESVGDDGIIRQ